MYTLTFWLVATILATRAMAFDPAHPCIAYPTKISRLSACSTASSFCSSYLKGSASFTRTSHITVYIPSSTDVESAATPNTTTETDSTTVITVGVTETDSPSIVTVGYVSTTTVTANSCSLSPSPSAIDRRAAQSSKLANTYCGIVSTMQSSQISGACNCYLASSTTVTMTVTSGVSTSESTGLITSTTTTTVSTEDTITVTPTSTVSTVSSTSTIYVPPIELPRATAIALPPANGYLDDETYALNIPFNISFFGTSSSNLVVSVNGFVALTGGVVQYGNLIYYDNRPLPQYGYNPYSMGVGTSVAPFWDDLIISSGTQQGLYYQINGDTVGARELQIEWFCSHYNYPTDYYHFVATFPEGNSNGVRFNYYQILDNGFSATVGAQSQEANMISQFSYDQSVITCGTVLTYSEATNTFVPSRDIGTVTR